MHLFVLDHSKLDKLHLVPGNKKIFLLNLKVIEQTHKYVLTR